jgi:tRNA threonylcarbamoyl adenosine modification protein YjeE
MNPPVWRIELPDEAATRALASDVAAFVGPGDLITLSGDLGAGKSTFARALLRCLANDPELETPSPTFTLMQVYETARFPVVHADLYRVKESEELIELGWSEAAEGALVVVEWAERAGRELANDRLDVALFTDVNRGPTFRRAEISGHGTMTRRLLHARGANSVLERSGWRQAERKPIQGDASSRAYELLQRPNGETAILMIAPPRPDGPAIKNGRSYSELVHLAEDIRPFVAIDQGLRALGLSAPAIYAVDLETGFAVLEDLGTEGVVTTEGAILERYMEAAGVLAFLHSRELPEVVPLGDEQYAIPRYDMDALITETELLLDWYAPHIAGITFASGARAQYGNAWRVTLAAALSEKATWCLRDFHSPNLLWLNDRPGLRRVGLLDFQDCVLGPPAYDVVSLAQDARVDISDEFELKVLSGYALARKRSLVEFDTAAFAASYAVMGAQRACKIIGIFARLDKRDNKPLYLKHLPRIVGYLNKNLKHPALAELKSWFEQNLPQLLSSEPRK